ncbi:MAG: FAD:protein FMN transferase [Chitinophagaceae bacterium]|nr:FAD:protein FMN transferase [Chitinophagaceae bacterium]
MKFIFLSFGTFLFLISCKPGIKDTIKISGVAQGTAYHITYHAKQNTNYRRAVDSILRRIDLSLSTYVPASIISRINNGDTSVITDDYFTDVFNKAVEVSEKTNGVFDITVAPLINAYGFGFTKKQKVDSILVDSILHFIGYKKVKLEGKKLVKEMPQVMLDFNAIAQGYTVDVLASFLESKGISNYMIELGGETKANGKKADGTFWTVGIEQPNEIMSDGSVLQAIVKLKNKALATSGNYKKYYIENGKKYTHIINPFTGYPAKNNLLSASVFAGSCMTADAYATSFMVMGLEKAKQFLAEHEELNLDVFFIYDEDGSWKTFTSEKLKENVEVIK